MWALPCWWGLNRGSCELFYPCYTVWTALTLGSCRVDLDDSRSGDCCSESTTHEAASLKGCLSASTSGDVGPNGDRYAYYHT